MDEERCVLDRAHATSGGCEDGVRSGGICLDARASFARNSGGLDRVKPRDRSSAQSPGLDGGTPDGLAQPQTKPP